MQMDNNTKLAELLKNTMKNAEQMASIMLSDDYENDILKNLTPDKKEEFLKAKTESSYEKSKTELGLKMQELLNLKNKK